MQNKSDANACVKTLNRQSIDSFLWKSVTLLYVNDNQATAQPALAPDAASQRQDRGDFTR